MGKERRGGYVFVSWIGDHAPRHVHVYRNGRLVLKWDLDHRKVMKGHETRKAQKTHRRTGEGWLDSEFLSGRAQCAGCEARQIAVGKTEQQLLHAQANQQSDPADEGRKD